MFRLKDVSRAVMLLCAGGLVTGVYAQEQSTQQLERIEITGSRIKRTTDFDTANPTTVVDADYLKQQGLVNVGDAMKSLPSNISNFSPTTTGNSNFFAGESEYTWCCTPSLLGKRTLVPTRTAVT